MSEMAELSLQHVVTSHLKLSASAELHVEGCFAESLRVALSLTGSAYSTPPQDHAQLAKSDDSYELILLLNQGA